MITRIRQLSLRKNQKGLAMVEYIIVLAVVAAIAATLFGGDNGLGANLRNFLSNAIDSISNTITGQESGG